MGSDARVWVNLLISWAPFLLLIGFWIFFMFFMRRGGFSKQREYLERNMAFMDRQELMLERIAIALEERNRTGRT
jgi:ATP-dependent Zn protease